MGMHERSFSSIETRPEPSGRPARFPSIKARKGTSPDCGAVARKRARRYLARRRLPKGLWPIILATIFMAMLFDRQIEPALAKALSRNGQARRKARATEDGQEKEVHPFHSETGAALNGEAALRYRPPADFQAKHAAQMIAFLIRNRGKLDNDVVREKWKHLDRTSMPLAVYLRNVEANDEWSGLEREIARCPSLPKSATDRLDAPSSVKHGRILELVPEWHRRGEDLLISSELDELAATEESDHHPDDDTPPKPTRR